MDEDGNLGDKIFEFFVKTKEQLKDQYTESEMDKFINNYMNYVIVRSLGGKIIQEFSLVDKKNIEIKVYMEKKLENIGINYNITGIDRIISFTNF